MPPVNGTSANPANPAVRGTHSAAGDGVSGSGKRGVVGSGKGGNGVEGASDVATGVVGISQTGHGVVGLAGPASGVEGRSKTGVGVNAFSETYEAVHAESRAAQVAAIAAYSANVDGTGAAVYAETLGRGMSGFFVTKARGARAVVGVSASATAVEGNSTSGVGVWGSSAQHEGMHAESSSADLAAIAAYALNPNGTGAGIYAETRGRGHAGFFRGNVHVTGNIATDGDVVLLGADCAERFESDDPARCEPGTVVGFDVAGRLAPSTEPYDTTVAGVVAGAGRFRPAIILDAGLSDASSVAVAMVGKAYCKVDAGYGAVKVGDLLTTSATPGHAMRVESRTSAIGAIVGKALQALPSGTGLIPVLVTRI